MSTNKKLIAGLIVFKKTWPDGNVSLRVKIKVYGDGIISESKPVACEVRLSADAASKIEALDVGNDVVFLGLVSRDIVWTMGAKGTKPALPVHALSDFDLQSFQVTRVKSVNRAEAELTFEGDAAKVKVARQYMPALAKAAHSAWKALLGRGFGQEAIETDNRPVDTETGELLEPIAG